MLRIALALSTLVISTGFVLASWSARMRFSSSKRRIIDLDVEHEAVELGFGQRIGAFLLDRVLRGDDEERLGQLVGLLAGGDLRVPASPASRAACVLGGVRLISSASTMLAKIGPWTKRNSRRPALVLVEDHGAGDVGRHQVGRELDALEADTSRIWLMELTMSVLASPGTPTSRQWPRVKMAARICSMTSVWPTIDAAELVEHLARGSG